MYYLLSIRESNLAIHQCKINFFVIYEYSAFDENIPAFFALLGVFSRTPVNTIYGPIETLSFYCVFNYFILFFFLPYINFFLTAFYLTCYFVCIPVQGKFPEEKKDTHGNCNA